jgi:hypothetical protein
MICNNNVFKLFQLMLFFSLLSSVNVFRKLLFIDKSLPLSNELKVQDTTTFSTRNILQPNQSKQINVRFQICKNIIIYYNNFVIRTKILVSSPLQCTPRLCFTSNFLVNVLSKIIIRSL